jgi:membrane protein
MGGKLYIPGSELLLVPWTTYRKFSADSGFNHCAAISYYSLVSTVPFLSLIASIFGFWLGSFEEGLEATQEQLRQVLPEAVPNLEGSARALIEYREVLGIAAVVGTVWAATLVFRAIQRAINQMFLAEAPKVEWHEGLLRGIWEWIRPFLLFIAATLLLIAGFALENTVALLRGLGPDTAQFIDRALQALPGSSLLTSLAVTSLVFTIVLKGLIPIRVTWRHVIIGALVGACGWEVARQLFGTYVEMTSSRMSVTGSAAVPIIFMFWVYYVAAVVLFSVELVSVLADRANARAKRRAK